VAAAPRTADGQVKAHLVIQAQPGAAKDGYQPDSVVRRAIRNGAYRRYNGRQALAAVPQADPKATFEDAVLTGPCCSEADSLPIASAASRSMLEFSH
jgi:hypothetical protein